MTISNHVRLAVAAILAGCVAPYAGASEAEASRAAESEAEIELEEAVVTGSSLRRLDAEDVLPVTVLGEDAMNLRDATTPAEMLTALPQVTNVPANEQPRGGAGARGDISTIAMRGLSASDTLVLLNGRRLVAHPTSEGAQFAPNVNQLPTHGLARIEILRDGASSIYGSDAVAGVVNYISDREFRGVEVSLRAAMPEEGGGDNQQATITAGTDFAAGRGRIMGTVDYFNREGIYSRDRDFARSTNQAPRAPEPWATSGTGFDFRPANGIYPRFTVGTGTAINFFRPVGSTMALTTVAPTRTANPEFFGDAAADNMLLGDSTRYNLFTAAEFDVTDSVTLFADFSYYNADSTIIRTPISLNAPSADALQTMSVNNPYNPYGSRFYSTTGAANADGSPRLTGTPRAVTFRSLTLNPNQLEYTVVESDTYRVVGGARGKLFDDWNWEVGLLHSYGKVSDSNPYSVRDSLLTTALQQTTPTTAYNPFGYTFKVQGGAVVADQPYTNPDSVIDSFTQEWIRYGNSTLSSIDAKLSGKVISIWGGDILAGVGAEHRKEKYEDYRPPFAGMNPPGSGLDTNNNDFIPASPKPDAKGDRDVTSVFAEAIVPLVSRANDLFLVDTLEVSGSVRREDYSDFGTTIKPKFGLNYRPVRAVMLRASYNEGFTAPSLPLLYNASQWAYAGAGNVDPYRDPATHEGPYTHRSGSAGNPDLQPVDSKGKSIGVVFEVPFVSGLSLSADYWNIKQTNMIGAPSAASIRNNDLLLLQAYTRARLAAGVPINQIEVTGIPSDAFANGLDGALPVAGYQGDPAVVRYAPTDADRALFAAYNAANPAAPLAVAGQVAQLNSPTLNLAKGVVAGWDFVLNYTTSLPIGRISLNSEWSYTDKSNFTQDVPGGAPIYNERLGIGGVTKWRGTTTLVWRNDSWTAGVSGYYIGSFADTGATTTAAVYASLGEPGYIAPVFTAGSTAYYYKVKDVLYFNAFSAYDFNDDESSWLSDVTVRLGVNNLANKQPPLAPGNFGFGYNVGVHGALVAGRTWAFELSKRF
ncbi:MAG: TonB-dependent receptor [Steroidobacteraceae bacterium]